MKKCALIINPCSGQKRVLKDVPRISSLLTAAGYHTAVYFTARHKHAEEIAMTCHDCDLIICTGGDGTLNQVVNGLVKSGIHVPIGYIPAGSTNDFANTLELSHSPCDAAQQIIYGQKMDCDIGMFDNQCFVYVASFGLFTAASYSTPQEVKNAFGPAAYFVRGFRELLNAPTYQVSITADDNFICGEYMLGLISNTLSVGGVMKFQDNDVDLNDGLFEVLMVRRPTTLKQCEELIEGFVNRRFDNEMFVYCKAKNVLVTTNKSIVWSLDGEESSPINTVCIKNLHSRIQIIK